MTTGSVLMTISNYRGFGGHEIVINNLCKGLRERGFRSAIGAFNFVESPPDNIEKVHLNRTRRLENGGDNPDFDIVHNHQTILNYYSLFTRKPFIFHYHGAANKMQEANLELSMRLCSRKITNVISVSNSGLARMRNIVGNHLRADVIYNGIDTDRFNTNLARPHVKGNPQLLFVGVLYSTKNVKMLIETMPRILTVYPDAHLQIVGPGSEHSSLIQLLKQMKLDQRIELIGRVSQSEIPFRYSSCDIYVSASKAETLPIPPFEAMACGKPVLLSDIPAHKEIIDASNGGLAFALDGRDLFNKLQEVYERKDSFGSNGRKFAEQNSWNQVCQKIAMLYEKVMT